MKRLNRLIAAVFLFISLFPLCAQDEGSDAVFIFEMDDIIIEDEQPEEEQSSSPGQVTVFDREDIESSGARTAAEVVERAPGVIVSKQGGILEPQSVSIRGGESEHVLVLVDGKPADSLWTGGADLSSIPVSNIRRIEVIRGAAAAVYGEGAVSGVINIITDGAGGNEPEGRLEYGYASFNTHLLEGRLSGPLGAESGMIGEIAAGGLYTGGEYEYSLPGGEQIRTNNDGWAAHASAGIGSDTDELSASGSFFASERGTPGLMEFLTPEARIMNIRAGGGADYSLFAGAAGIFDFTADYAYLFSNFVNPEEWLDDTNESSSAAASAGWTVDFEPGNALLRLDTGISYTFNHLYSTALTDSTGSAVGGEAVQHAAALRVILDMIAGPFDLRPAAGLDWNLNDYKALDPSTDIAFTWLASAGWSPFRTDYEEGPLYFRLNGGTAYRNPSFQDLFWPSGALAAGNPDLRPETSISIDGGGSYRFPETGGVSAVIDAAGFFSRTEDLIQWLPSAGGIWRPRNVGSVYSGGLELSGGMRAAELIGAVSLDISLAYNWLKSVDADTASVNYGKQLAYRPEHSGNLSLLFSMPDVFTFEITGGYIGYRYTNNANTKFIDQVFLLSAAAGYDFNEHFGLSVSADNLLNKSYIDRLGYPVPGLEWSLKGRANL